MNKRLENKINRWYGDGIRTRVWLAKHWYRWITFGCTQHYIENCGCGPNNGKIDDPKGFAEIAEYAYDNYGRYVQEMNIFYLDRDPVVAAQMMCDKHVVKMILESAQMLSTAHRVLDGDEYADRKGLYKLAHKNHPSTIWVRSSLENYTWLYDHMVALMAEYTYRYGKHHATERLLAPLFKSPKNMDFETFFSDPPQCMPEACKGEDTVDAYQKYYIEEKSNFATWKCRAVPEWFNAKRESLGLHGATNA